MSNQDNPMAIVATEEFLDNARRFRQAFHDYYSRISQEETPAVDGKGHKIIDKRPDGYDYIVESYMREKLDEHFPGWSWESAAPLHFLGSEWVVAQGHLVIPDPHLLALGINPPIRKFYGVDSVRVQYRKNQPHTPENIVDIGDNCKQANTAAMKYAINRLTHIGDDVYGKRVEMEGAGSFEEVFETKADAATFNELLKKHSIKWSEVFEICEVEDATQITDYTEAWNRIKKKRNIQ